MYIYSIHSFIYIYIYIYIYVCVCVYVCVYIYICTERCTHAQRYCSDVSLWLIVTCRHICFRFGTYGCKCEEGLGKT